MTAVEQLTLQIARLSVILERIEPHVADLDVRMRRLERFNSWSVGAIAGVSAMLGAAAPFLLSLLPG